ncbi:thermonuclease family protein [Bacillus sp. CRN 9]|nr:thermonuclease family protein [Bacillus sp. CRN 9]
MEKLDSYDRTLAYVYLQDDRMLNEELLREGLAKVVVFEPIKKYWYVECKSR